MLLSECGTGKTFTSIITFRHSVRQRERDADEGRIPGMRRYPVEGGDQYIVDPGVLVFKPHIIVVPRR